MPPSPHEWGGSLAAAVDDVRPSARKGSLHILGKGGRVREVPIHPKLCWRSHQLHLHHHDPVRRSSVQAGGVRAVALGRMVVHRPDRDVALGCLGNAIWFVFGGIWLALGHVIAGVVQIGGGAREPHVPGE